MTNFIERVGQGRRREDGFCVLHETHQKCFDQLKESMKHIIDRANRHSERLAAIEPTVKHNQHEIDGMKKIMITTLVSTLVAAGSTIVTLAIIAFRS